MVLKRATQWCETLGGPHVLLSEESQFYWRGSEGYRDHADPNDHSDYAKACRVDGWLGILDRDGYAVLVFGGDVGPVASYQDSDEDLVYFVQWLGVDHEDEILAALDDPDIQTIFSDVNSEEVSFITGKSGHLTLLDAAEQGREVRGESAKLKLLPGRYTVRAGYLETETLIIVVRKFQKTNDFPMSE